MAYADPKQAWSGWGLYGKQFFSFSSWGLVQYRPGSVQPVSPSGRIVTATLGDRTITVGQDDA